MNVVRLCDIILVLTLTSFASSEASADTGSECTSPIGKQGICTLLKKCPSLLSLNEPPVSEENTKLLRESVCFKNNTNVFVCCPKEDCRNPLGQMGVCLKITSCSEISDILKKRPITPAQVEFLRSSQCGFVDKTPLVCCTFNSDIALEVTTKKTAETTEVESPDWLVSLVGKVPQPPNCGVQLIDRIFGGNVAEISEFPWLALLEYKKPSNTSGYHCGGSLINNRYVITAAHCVRKIPQTWELSSIVLGEWQLSSEIDCEDPEIKSSCAPSVQRIDIEKTIVHPEYRDFSKDQNNDIALLRLARKVEFTEFVSPICLPLDAALWNMDYTNYTFEVSGWGKTENTSKSDFKMKVKIPFFDSLKCKELYQAVGKKVFETQLCVGGEEGKDSCNGDSGGPLMRLHSGTHSYWYLSGVVSYGPSNCGTANLPGVYTRVSKYLEWFSGKMKP